MLDQLKPNELARIVAIDGEHILRKKLFSRGITENSIIRVISSYGLITFEIGRKTFAIGRGMAQKIRVIKVI
jgi:Fe2+ transport system protein FeoA